MTPGMDDAAILAAAVDQARRVVLVDKHLRAMPLAGQSVDLIKPQAEAALAQIGVSLPDADLTAYAQSISDREAYEFELG